MDLKNNGETSRKKSHDICDSERPLKKARYLWQVKGKYHLKDSNSKHLNNESMDTSENEPTTQKEVKNDKVNELITMNNNIAQARNKNICNERTCIDFLIASSDKIMEFPDPDSPPRNIERSISDEIPVTLVKPRPKNEDFYLRKWQARQIAKGFVDNTINRVLENWMVAPFDAADFVENCDNGGQVEDEGILMAIQSHGLQSCIREVNYNNSNNSSDCRPNGIFSSGECTCSKTRKEVTPNRPLPFHSRLYEESMEQDYYENLCVLKDTEPVQPNNILNPGKPSKEVFAPIHSEDSKENDPTLHITENIQDLALPNNGYDLRIDDTDFLDAAVSVAIKKKGLTSYNCVDYG